MAAEKKHTKSAAPVDKSGPLPTFESFASARSVNEGYKMVDFAGMKVNVHSSNKALTDKFMKSGTPKVKEFEDEIKKVVAEVEKILKAGQGFDSTPVIEVCVTKANGDPGLFLTVSANKTEGRTDKTEDELANLDGKFGDGYFDSDWDDEDVFNLTFEYSSYLS